MEVAAQFASAETSAILPPSVDAFISSDFSDELNRRLIVCPKGLLGVGAYGAVFEAALALPGSIPSVVAVKFQALPEEASSFK